MAKKKVAPKPVRTARPGGGEIELNDEDIKKVVGGLNPQLLLPDREKE